MWALLRKSGAEEENKVDIFAQAVVIMKDAEFACNCLMELDGCDGASKLRAQSRLQALRESFAQLTQIADRKPQDQNVCGQTLSNVRPVNLVSNLCASGTSAESQSDASNSGHLVSASLGSPTPGNIGLTQPIHVAETVFDKHVASMATQSLSHNIVSPSGQNYGGQSINVGGIERDCQSAPVLSSVRPHRDLNFLNASQLFNPMRVPSAFSSSMSPMVSNNVFPHVRNLGYGVTTPVSHFKFHGGVMEYFEFNRKFTKFVAEVYLDDDVRMTYLESLCVGKAGRAIKGLSGHTDWSLAYRTAWESLEQRFGNRNVLMTKIREDLLSGSNIQEYDAAALNNLRDKMFECKQTYESMGKLQELDSPDVINKLFSRLPEGLRKNFVTMYRYGQRSFKGLRGLIDDATCDAECMLGKQLFNASQVAARKPKWGGFKRNLVQEKVKVSVIKEKASAVESKPIVKCLMCSEAHKLWNCASFKNKTARERNQFAKDKRLCFNCLKAGHRVSECSYKQNCKECGKRHNSLLHFVSSSGEVAPQSDASSTYPSEVTSGSGQQVLISSNFCDKSQCKDGKKLLKVVPVRVWVEDSNKSVCTWAYMDDGSEVSLCTAVFAKRLGASLCSTSVQMHTSDAVTLVYEKVNRFHIQDIGESQIFMVNNILVQDKLVDVASSIPTDDMVSVFSHLQDLTFLQLETISVELLLGQNVRNAFRVSEMRYGCDDESFGLHTALGWTLRGVDHFARDFFVSDNVSVNFIKEMVPNEDSCQQVLNIFDHEFWDVDVPQVPCMSRDDKRALKIMEESAVKVDKHLKIALPWSEGKPDLPLNRDMAEKRLNGLKKRLLADPELCSKYSEKITDMLEHGYAIRLPVDAPIVPGRTRYIPHHCASILSKFRIVFDCSAKFSGVYLTDQLLQGAKFYK